MTDAASTYTAPNLFRQMMRDRRAFSRGSLDYEWRTRAARKYVWLMRGVPASQWGVK